MDFLTILFIAFVIFVLVVVVNMVLFNPEVPLRYFAELIGDNEVPPVSTDAYGDFVLHPNARTFLLRVRGADFNDVSTLPILTGGAHLHCGEVGQNGGVIFAIASTEADWVLEDNHYTVSGTLSDDDLTGECGVNTFEQLDQSIRDGMVYVNVHTIHNPGGEIRGQLQASQ